MEPPDPRILRGVVDHLGLEDDRVPIRPRLRLEAAQGGLQRPVPGAGEDHHGDPDGIVDRGREVALPVQVTLGGGPRPGQVAPGPLGPGVGGRAAVDGGGEGGERAREHPESARHRPHRTALGRPGGEHPARGAAGPVGGAEGVRALDPVELLAERSGVLAGLVAHRPGGRRPGAVGGLRSAVGHAARGQRDPPQRRHRDPVGSRPGVGAVARERCDRRRPGERGGVLPRRGAAGRAHRRIRREREQGPGHGGRVLGGNGDPQLPALDRVGEGVARGADHRQPRPQVVEDASAEGEPGLDVIEVGGDADVGVEQPVGALVVRNPVRVEEDVAAGEPQLRGEPLGLGVGPHLLDLRVGMPGRHEHQAQRRTLRRGERDRPDHGERVEPGVDAAAPEHHDVVAVDSRDAVANRVPAPLRRLGGNPEGHHVDERAQRRVVGVGVRIHAVERAQRTQPVVALLLARTEHEVGVPDGVVDGPQRLVLHLQPRLHRRARGDEQLLEREGVVQVDDEALRRVAQPGTLVEHESLHHHHVEPRRQALEPGGVVGLDGERLWREVGGERRGQRHRVSESAELTGELEATDRRTGHPLAHVLVGQDQYSAHPGASIAARPWRARSAGGGSGAGAAVYNAARGPARLPAAARRGGACPPLRGRRLCAPASTPDRRRPRLRQPGGRARLRRR